MDKIGWPNELPHNIWLGVSVENQKVAHSRIWHLCQVPVNVRFISAEPLLGMLDLGFDAWLADENGTPGNEKIGDLIHWVITGGESGAANKIRKAEIEWFKFIRDQCLEHGISFFHKQNGGSKKINGAWGGREIDGVVWNEFPSTAEMCL